MKNYESQSAKKYNLRGNPKKVIFKELRINVTISNIFMDIYDIKNSNYIEMDLVVNKLYENDGLFLNREYISFLKYMHQEQLCDFG